MSKQDNLTDFLTDVADAIREKKGTTEKINPQNFSEEIRGIESGGDGGVNADFILIDDTVFGFNNIQEIVIHEGVTSIGYRALRYNESVARLSLPSTLTAISDYSFNGMTNLTSLTIPASVTSIGTHAFALSVLTTLVIPQGVTRPGYGCCTNCNRLKTVTLLQTKGSVASNSYSGCTSLQYVSFPNAEVMITLEAADAFSNTTCSIIVPDALYDEWIAATNWSTYADRIVKASEYVEPTNNE